MRKSTRSAYRPLTSSLSKLSSAAAICAALTIASASSAGAATYYWDADGSAAGNNINTGLGLGKFGTWSTPSWFNPAAPASDVLWPNTNPSADTAIFTGESGEVALDSEVFVNTLQFNTNGYSIWNGGVAANTLNLSGANPTINVVNSGDTAIIDALIAGNQGLIKTGAGTVTLNRTGSTFTGDVLIQGGTLAFTGVAGSNDQTAFGAGAKKIILTNNATLALVGSASADPNVAGGKGFVIGTGGGTIDVASGLTFFLNDGVSNGSAQNQLQGTGTLTKAGSGVLNVGRDFASTFSGDVVVKQGRLDVTVANALGNTGTITVDGTNGPARLNYTNTTAFAFTNDLVLQNGGVLSLQGNSHNLPNTKAITIGSSTAGAARIRVDDGSSDSATATNRTFVLNGALNGSNTLEITGPNGATRGVLAVSNAASNFSGTIVIDKNVSVENFARWNGTTATNTGKTIGTATIKFDAISNGSGSSTDGQLDLRDSGTGNNQVFNYGNNVDMTSTGGTIVVGNNTQAAVASTGGRFVLGTLSLGPDKTLTVNTANSYSLEFGGVTTFGGNATINNAANLTLTGGITGGANFTKNGAGLLSIGAPAGNTYSGTTTINAGGVIFTGANGIGGTGASVTLANNTLIGANFAATQANLIDRIVKNSNTSVIALGQDTSADLNLTGLRNARLGAVGGTVTYSGTLTTDAASNTIYLGGGGGTLVITKADTVSGTRNLDIGTYGTAAGVVALDQPQNFTGSVTLGGGQLLRIGSNASLGNTANVVTANGGGIQFKDAASGFDIFATRTINFTGGFILDTNGYNYTPSVAIGGNGGSAGTGNFTKAGAGKLTLDKTVLYNGKTIVTGGTLSIADQSILGAVPGTETADQIQIQSGGTLEANGTFAIPLNRGVQFSNGGGAINVTEGNKLTVASKTNGNGQLIKEGTGTLTLTADPNHTGGFTINAGVLELQHSGSTDGHFVINNDATLRVLTANDLGDAYNVTVNSGALFDLRASDQISLLLGSGTVRNDGTAAATLTLSHASTNATFSGTIDNGASTLALTKGGANAVTFGGTNTYTGTTSINTGQIRVEGAAARLSGGGLVAVGDNNGNDESLVLGSNTDVVTNVFDKIADSSQLDFRGSTSVTINGPAASSTAFTETMGNINFRDGTGILTLNSAAGGQLQVNAGTLIREFGTGTGVIRGTNLGGTGADSSRVTLSSTSGLLVGSGGTGSQASIVPFLIGGTSATEAPDTFLTYDAAKGFTPLKASDYEATIAGSAGRNVSVTGGETVSANTSINALRVTGGSTTLTGARVGLDSGAILFTGTGSIGGNGTIDSGARQLIIHAAGDTTSLTGTVSANVAAGAGLVVGDAGDIGHTIVLSGNNGIVGGVTINGGTLRAGSANALGMPGAPLNDLTLKAGNNAIGGALSSAFQLGGNDIAVLFNGNDRLQGSTRIQNASATPATLTIVTNAASGSNDGVLEDGTGGGALSFQKRGTAQLTLEQVNSYTGTTEILGGTVQLNTANGRFSGTSGITIAGGGILNLNNTNSANQGDRLRDAAPITMHGGQFQFDNNQNAANYSETAGALIIASGSNQIVTDFAAANQTSTLTFASMSVAAGAAVNFTNFATSGDVAIGESGTRNRVILTTDPTATNGIIGGNVYYTKNFSTATTFDPVDFASYDFDTDGTGADVENGIIVFSGYNTGAETSWTNTSVVRPAATATLTANRTVHAMKLDLGVDVTVGASQTLNLASGGLIYNPNSTTASTSTIAGGKLTAGSAAGAELAIRVDGNLNAATLVINSEIANNAGGAVSLLKSGPDALILGGTNTYTGRTTIAEGSVRIASDSNLGTAPAVATAGHLRLYGGTLEVAGTMELNANRGIELGGAAPMINVTSGTLSYNGSFSVAGNAASTDLSILGNVAFGGGVKSIPGGLNVGSNMASGFATNSSTVTFASTSGTLSIGANSPATSDLNIAYRPSAPTNDTANDVSTGTLDLQALSSFDAQLATLRVGVLGSSGGSNAKAKGTLLLPAASTITASNGVVIGDSTAAGNETMQSALRFGAGSSTLTTTSLIAGGRKGNGLVSLANGGTLTLTGFVPNSADLLVAYNNQDGTGVTSTGTADFSAGTLVADLDELVVGFKNGAGAGSGGATGTVSLGATNNNVVANQIRLGDYSGGSSGTAAGTLNVGGGSVVVNNDVSLGLYTGAGSTGGAAGTLNITGGSVRIEGNIVTSNSDRSASTVNLNGGTLDVTGGNISADTFNAQTGVLRNVGQIYGGDGTTPAMLTKTGPGTLEIQGANTYTGGTKLNEGTLLLNGSLNGTLATASGTTLGGSGSINGALTLGDNSTLRIELDGLAAGTGYDQLRMTSTNGSVSLGQNVTLSLSLGFTPNTTTDTFYYILTRDDNGTSYGNLFAGLGEGALINLGNGIIGKLTYQANWTGNAATSSFTGGNDVAIAVPEPGSVATLLGGLGTLVGLGRFRRRQARA